MPLTYTEYLQLNKILDAQSPRSAGEHDEMLFIVIHQVYELWFKQLLHEGQLLSRCLREGDTWQALATLKRCLTVLKTMVSQTDILETMTPVSFSQFRDRLETSSGFQSAQFRMFEFWLGKKDQRMIDHHQADPETVRKLQALYEAPSLADDFVAYLHKADFPVPETLLNRDVTQPLRPDPDLQNILIEIYRHDPLVSQICERLVDLDEGIQEWRYRHVKMVERTIGNKDGTGGSPGVRYLKQSLFQPFFPDLWAIRARL